jgi:hypothetical protein
MVDHNGRSKLTMDRRGTSVLVPIGLGAVFAVLPFLMLVRGSHENASPPPDNVGSGTASSRVLQ